MAIKVKAQYPCTPRWEPQSNRRWSPASLLRRREGHSRRSHGGARDAALLQHGGVKGLGGNILASMSTNRFEVYLTKMTM